MKPLGRTDVFALLIFALLILVAVRRLPSRRARSPQTSFGSTCAL